MAAGAGACGGSSPTGPLPPVPAAPVSPPIPATRADLKPVIEALFLGSGPLSPRDGQSACPFPGYWSGFSRGTQVRIRVSSAVSGTRLAAIEDAASQVGAATHGWISVVAVDVVDDPDPRPGAGEVTSMVESDPITRGCPLSIGCIIHDFLVPGVFVGGRAILPPNQTSNAFAHDVVGHGILGMCHIDGERNGGAGRSLMSGGPNVFSSQIASRPTALDIEAAQAVYASPLTPGATRVDFVRLGLIEP